MNATRNWVFTDPLRWDFWYRVYYSLLMFLSISWTHTLWNTQFFSVARLRHGCVLANQVLPSLFTFFLHWGLLWLGICAIYIEAYYCEVKLRKLFYRLHYYWIFFWFLNMQECLVLTLQGCDFASWLIGYKCCHLSMWLPHFSILNWCWVGSKTWKKVGVLIKRNARYLLNWKLIKQPNITLKCTHYSVEYFSPIS